ncbi:DUF309 domain-containing protein [Thiothrix winogradskyi]|uniref:DUF309 domain-containing protein n=1 Tax=Thiothrix winogradskyi TaxID=96472 RepID=A0ABY3T527_9GAMM|nr:DUF309 domain-containing protein [Thiothrix winogradskyi]UJS26324.1 DUF309 domain-containing protein [Thiothrix winogradskyi]
MTNATEEDLKPLNLNVFWPELAALWDAGDFGAAHDWLGERWNVLIQSRPQGHDDPDARFLQGLAYAVLAFHFTQHANQDGARLMVEDTLRVLPEFTPAWAGMETAPVIASVKVLQPLLEGLDNEAPCPLQPFRCEPLKFTASEMSL